uniref:Uncharacterized protein n=1 Tax=viral metagenome TaxID=1070528 RepID=A0A6M3LLF3_9ZZZZ
MLRPTNITYMDHRVWIETDDVGINAHMSYRVKTKACTLNIDDSLPDVDAIDNGKTVEPARKKVVQITTRYTCAVCKAGFESPKMAGRAKACPICGMATVIDHAAQKQVPVPPHWSDGINATPEDKAIMRQYLTSKEYIERPAQHLEAPMPIKVPEASTQPDDTQAPTPALSETRYVCNACNSGFERAVLVNKKKTCRECGSDDITDNVVTDMTE